MLTIERKTGKGIERERETPEREREGKPENRREEDMEMLVADDAIKDTVLKSLLTKTGHY